MVDQPEPTQPDRAKPDDAKPDDAKPDDAKPDDAKPDRADPGDARSGPAGEFGRAPIPGGPLGPRMARARRTSARHRRFTRAGWVVGAAVLVLLLAVGGYAFYLNGQIHRVGVHDLTGSGAGPKGTENILLVGSTSRCALKVQNPAYGLCSKGVTGVNSDVVMILHLNAGQHVVSVLSIPRDTFIPNARAQGANKIDAALAQGPSQLVAAIQQDFGIPIQHYMELNFDTFSGVVDALGGVRMYFPQPLFDGFSGLNVPAPGCRELNGEQALQVVRARHLQYRTPQVSSDDPRNWPQENESDLARIRRNHEFLRVLAGAVARQGLGNPLTDQRIVAAVAPKLEVDSGMSTRHLVDLVLTYHSININSAPQLTLPIVQTSFGTYYYRNGNYGQIVWPSQPQDQQVIHQFLGAAADTDTMTGHPLPAAGSVQVSVLNGTGAPHQAGDTAASLQALGFPVVHTGDTPAVARQAETVVYYAGPGDQPAAEAVLRTLSGYAILGMDPAMVTPGSQVTVVTGTHFAVAPPVPGPGSSPATTPGGPSTSRPASAPPATPGSGQAPTAPVESLAPWDPRSCTPTGGEGP